MPVYKITLKDIEIQGSIGPDLKFFMSSDAAGFSDRKVWKKKDSTYLLKGEIPITAPTTVDVTARVVEKDKYDDEGQEPILVSLKPEDTEVPASLSVTVKENYGPSSTRKPRQATFTFKLLFTLRTLDSEQRKVRADKFVPVLNRALDTLLPAVSAGCTLDRADTFSLLLNTANHESDGFSRVAEYNNGSGEGLVQMIPKTYDDMWDRYLELPDNKKLAKALRQLAGVQSGKPDRALLKTDSCYASGMALLRYIEHGAGADHPVPPAGDVQAQSRYWGKHYQTEEDPGLMEKFVDSWKATFEPVVPEKPAPKN